MGGSMLRLEDMYGFPQEGSLEQELLKECLAKHEYTQSKLIPGLLKHHTKPMEPQKFLTQ